MDDKALLRILKQEAEDSASYHQSELARVQADALERYQANAYGDELPNRSSVRTHDLEDTINWIMPHLMRPFISGDQLIGVDDEALDDMDPSLKQASDLLLHVLRKDNNPKRLIHDLAFDGLLMRGGIGRTSWRDPEPKPERIMEGVTPEQLDKYLNDAEYELLEVEQEQKIAEGQPYECYTIKLRHKPKIGRVALACIPPEQFRISRRATAIETADYHGWHWDAYLAEIIRDNPDKKDELMTAGTGEGEWSSVAGDSRVEARFPNEATRSDENGSADEIGRRKVVRSIEYIRADVDGDGTVELRRIDRAGDVILSNDAVEESEFSLWSPIRMSHRAIGRSIADTIVDLQKIRTGLTRAALDGLSRSLTPRTAVNTEATTEDTLTDIVDHDMGGVVRVKGDVRAAMQELVTPDVSQPALAAMEYFDRRTEEASGVTRHAQGIAPEAITKTKGGIAMLQAAANARIELLAQWLAECLEDMLGKALRLLIAHQDGPRTIKLLGKRMQIDPRRWSDEMTVTVHVGAVGEDRDARITGLGILAQKQEQILLQAGPSNPMVTLQEYRHTLAMIAEAMGHRSPERFFREIPEGWQPPPPGPDPKTAEVQQKGQLAAAELQAKQQLQAAELQSKQQLAQIELNGKQAMAQMQAEVDSAIASQKAQLEQQIAVLKAENERQIAELRIASESQIARERMAAEMQLAGWKAAQDVKVKRHQVNANAKAKSKSKGSSSSMDDVRFGGQIG